MKKTLGITVLVLLSLVILFRDSLYYAAIREALIRATEIVADSESEAGREFSLFLATRTPPSITPERKDCDAAIRRLVEQVRVDGNGAVISEARTAADRFNEDVLRELPQEAPLPPPVNVPLDAPQLEAVTAMLDGFQLNPVTLTSTLRAGDGIILSPLPGKEINLLRALLPAYVYSCLRRDQPRQALKGAYMAIALGLAVSCGNGLNRGSLADHAYGCMLRGMTFRALALGRAPQSVALDRIIRIDRDHSRNFSTVLDAATKQMKSLVAHLQEQSSTAMSITNLYFTLIGYGGFERAIEDLMNQTRKMAAEGPLTGHRGFEEMAEKVAPVNAFFMFLNRFCPINPRIHRHHIEAERWRELLTAP